MHTYIHIYDIYVHTYLHMFCFSVEHELVWLLLGAPCFSGDVRLSGVGGWAGDSGDDVSLDG